MHVHVTHEMHVHVHAPGRSSPPVLALQGGGLVAEWGSSHRARLGAAEAGKLAAPSAAVRLLFFLQLNVVAIGTPTTSADPAPSMHAQHRMNHDASE